MRRRLVPLAALALLLPSVGSPAAIAQQWPVICVNTTGDPVLQPNQCLPGEPCSFRAAIERGDNHQVVITACFDRSIVPTAKACPPGCRPIEAAAPEHLDAAAGKYILTYRTRTSEFSVRFGAVRVDFGYLIDGWSGPADNRIVFDPDLTRDADEPPLTHAINVTGNDAVFRSFDLRGSYAIAAFLVKDGASNNQFGPGLAFDGLEEGAGILLQDSVTVANRVVGNWCGVSGPARTSLGIRDDCIQLARGTRANVIGGSDPADRNILSGSELGAGVAIEGGTTRDNTIQGNWIGLGPDGDSALPNNVGVRLIGGASNTRIIGNVISGNGAGGIAVSSAGSGTVIDGNLIGPAATGDGCVANRTSGVSVGGEVFDALVTRNRIHCNDGTGVAIRDPYVSGIKISANSITRNRGRAIQINPEANSGVRPPTIASATGTMASGRTCTACVVELFTDPATQASVFEGTTTADLNGQWRFEKPDGERFAYMNLRVTATNGNSTSELSEPRILPANRTPSPTPFYQTATPTSPVQPTATATLPPTPRPTPEGGYAPACLPWARRGAPAR